MGGIKIGNSSSNWNYRQLGVTDLHCLPWVFRYFLRTNFCTDGSDSPGTSYHANIHRVIYD